MFVSILPHLTKITGYLATIERDSSTKRCSNLVNWLCDQLNELQLTDVDQIVGLANNAFNSGRISSQPLINRALFITSCAKLTYLNSLPASAVENMVNSATALLQRRDQFTAAYSACLLGRLAHLLSPSSPVFSQQLNILLTNMTLVVGSHLKHRNAHMPLMLTCASARDLALLSIRAAPQPSSELTTLVTTLLDVIPNMDDGPEKAVVYDVIVHSVSELLNALGTALPNGDIDTLVEIFGHVFLVLRTYHNGTLPDGATALLVRAVVDQGLAAGLARIPNFMCEFLSFAVNLALGSTGLLANAGIHAIAEVFALPGFIRPPLTDAVVLGALNGVKHGQDVETFKRVVEAAFSGYLDSHGLLGSGMVASLKLG